MIERYVTLACVSNEVGGDLIGNARWLGVPVADLLDEARPGPGRRPGGQPVGRRLHRRHADRGAARRPRRDARGRDERRAAAGRARVPGPHGRARPVRVRLGHEVARRAGADHVRRLRRVLGAARLGRSRRRSRRSRGSTAPRRARRCRPARSSWPGSPGPSTAASPRSRSGWTTGRGRRRRWPRWSSIDTWRLWSWRGRRRRASTRCTVRATDNGGEVQTESAGAAGARRRDRVPRS